MSKPKIVSKIKKPEVGKTYFRHIRLKSNEGITTYTNGMIVDANHASNLGGATYMWKILKPKYKGGGYRIKFSRAICSTNDNFSKEKGRSIAKDKYTQDPITLEWKDNKYYPEFDNCVYNLMDDYYNSRKDDIQNLESLIIGYNEYFD